MANKKIRKVAFNFDVYTEEELNEGVVDFKELNKRYDDAFDAVRNAKAKEGDKEVLFGILESTFILPVFTRTDTPNGPFVPVKLRSNQNDSILPIFTSVMDAAKLNDIPEGLMMKYFVLKYNDLKTFIKNNKGLAEIILINSGMNGRAYTVKEFTHIDQLIKKEKELEEMLQTGVVPHDMPVKFIESRTFPTKAVNAVHDICLDELKNVELAFYKSCMVDKFNCFAFIIKCDDNQEETFKKIHDAAQSASRGTPVIVMEYKSGLEPILKNDIALYDRELGF